MIESGVRHYKNPNFVQPIYMGFISMYFFLINLKKEVPKCLKCDKHWENEHF